MNRYWLVGCAVIALVAVGVSATPGCASDPCEELADMCSSCPREEYRVQCEQAAASGNESVCQSQVNAFDAYCAGTSTGGGGPDAGPECDPDETVCPPGVCTLLGTDPVNCGACGAVCEDQFCSQGTCTDECLAPLVECNGGCVNYENDPRNCDACERDCASLDPTRSVCSQGECVAECDAAGLYPTNCSGACVNLSSDPLHCGACGNACQPGQVCSAGSCASECEEGLTNCCGVCVNTMQNPEHCGGCDPILCPSGGGTGGGGALGGAGGGATGGAGGAGGGGGSAPEPEACGNDPSNPVCLEGQCEPGCGDFFTDCGGACVNTATDPFNCGSCGNACGPGEVCTDGACAGSCAAGETDCSGSCVDLTSSTAHCGECGNVCKALELCSQGTCMSDCAVGLDECPPGSGACVDYDTDPANCGSCGAPCLDPTPLCSQKTCVSGCPAGEANCDGSCVDLDTDFNHCGSCGNSCNDNSICTVDYCDGQGECKNDSGALVCNDGNQCTNDLCDAKKGCYSEPVTMAQLEALCSAPHGPNDCLFCDPDGATCNVVPKTDNIDCTEDSCPDSAVATEADIKHEPNDGLCTAAECQRCDPSSGCFDDDSYCTPANGCTYSNCDSSVSGDSCGCI